MHISDLNGKSICILGYGKEGQAMVRALERYAPNCKITIADENSKIENKACHPEQACPEHCRRVEGSARFEYQTGPHYLENLDRFDVIIKSPGIPPSSKLKAQSSKLTSSTQIFLDSIADSGATVVGVTGSKGKSTTSSLIHHILKSYVPSPRSQVLLIGNIGEPAIAHLKDAKNGTIFVMELSSYQLLDLKASPHIAVITSFFPEHLDYHSTRSVSLMASPSSNTPLENYLDAKKNIARYQKEDDIVFFCADSRGAAEIAKEGNGRKIPFSSVDAPIKIEETHLLGVHNLSNIAAAFAVARELGIDDTSAIAAIKSFHGLPHRLQSLGIHHGAQWIDDAISTAPESTIAALDALGERVETIILGGQVRGNDFTELGMRIAHSGIKHVILFSGSGPRIRKAIEEAGAKVEFFEADSMEEAVNFAKSHTRHGEPVMVSLPNHESMTSPVPLSLPKSQGDVSIVLLSTASPSYGMFKNFEEKGKMFAECIRQSL